MSFQLCKQCKTLWTHFGSGPKPDICPSCQKQVNAKTPELEGNGNNKADFIVI